MYSISFKVTFTAENKNVRISPFTAAYLQHAIFFNPI